MSKPLCPPWYSKFSLVGVQTVFPEPGSLISPCFHDKWTSHKLSELSALPRENPHPHQSISTRDEPECCNCPPTKPKFSQPTHKVWPSNTIMKWGHTSGNHSAHFTVMHLSHSPAAGDLGRARRYPDYPSWAKWLVGVILQRKNIWKTLMKKEILSHHHSSLPHSYLILVLSYNIWFYDSTGELNFILVI